MRKVFTKEQAQKLEFADAVHLWMNLYDINAEYYSEHYNCFIWKIYGTRLDIHGLSRKNWNLTWNTYGTKWILTTPNNSYNKQITLDEMRCYLETGDFERKEIVKCKDCGKEIFEEDAEYCDFNDGSGYICEDCLDNYGYCEVCRTWYNEEKDNVEVYGLRGGTVCSECYDVHGWRYE